MTGKAAQQLQAFREFFASIDDADTESMDNEELERRVQQGLSRLRSELRQVKAHS